jgi:predicted TIM-barrel fold metal-dependent hydrolase
MSTDLALHLEQIRVVDTHEHLWSAERWRTQPAFDVLRDLMPHYVQCDLISAGAPRQDVLDLERGDLDPADRWSRIEPWFEHIRHTGYGEAVLLHARHIYGMDAITPRGLHDAAGRLAELRRPGMRLAILRDMARFDHVQIDAFQLQVEPDPEEAGFFLYDLRWADLCRGRIDFALLAQMSGVTVVNLTTLAAAMRALVERSGPRAIALKAQHAYDRTLKWQARSDADAERALQSILVTPPNNLDPQACLCLGDWCWARGVELAVEFSLPFKMHTGYLTSNGYMDLAPIDPALLTPLLRAYPDARFVLMHAGYPHGAGLVALAKHFRNVYVDLCWAWAIDPRQCSQLVRSFLHAAPANKLLGFGGDCFLPTVACAYGLQMRQWLTRTLEAAVRDGDLAEPHAMQLATRMLRDNALALFDVAGRQATLRSSARPAAAQGTQA